ncbi:MAG: ClpXP protease specificity-enhancing factor [Cellvibrionales bacterium]|nr:ClpXP protease specificity-enhancing factor [Cellvibrionales bacterium]
MTPSRPYLLRAVHEWILDNRATPHILVNALHPEVRVPQDYVTDGQIILNIAPDAVADLSLGNDWLCFSARFRGIPTDISVPLEAVLGIYAKENGRGMMFAGEENQPDPTPPPPKPVDSKPAPGSATKPTKPRRPTLRVVK